MECILKAVISLIFNIKNVKMKRMGSYRSTGKCMHRLRIGKPTRTENATAVSVQHRLAAVCIIKCNYSDSKSIFKNFKTLNLKGFFLIFESFLWHLYTNRHEAALCKA